MTAPIGPNNQIYYTGELGDKLKEADIKGTVQENRPQAGVMDTMIPTTDNWIAGFGAVAVLDFLMNLALRGGEKSLLFKLVDKIEGSKWAIKQRAYKFDVINNLEKDANWLSSKAAKKNPVARSLKRRIWRKNAFNKFFGKSKKAFIKGEASSSVGMKMPPGFKWLDITDLNGRKEYKTALKTHRKLLKEYNSLLASSKDATVIANKLKQVKEADKALQAAVKKAKGLTGSMKSQRDLIKKLNESVLYKTIFKNGKIIKIAKNPEAVLKNGEKVSLALKNSMAISRFISNSYAGMKHFVGNAMGGGGNSMKFLQKLGGGSLFGYVVNGMFIGSSIQAARKAPEGEKGKVLMEDLIGNWLFGFAFWPAISKRVHKIAGLSHTGNIAKEVLKGTSQEINATKYHYLDQIVKTGNFNRKASIFKKKIMSNGKLINNPKYNAKLHRELIEIVAKKNPQRVARKAIKLVRKDLLKKIPFKHRIFNRLGRIAAMGRNHTWTNVKNTKGLRKVGKFLNYAFKRIPGGLFRMVVLVGLLTAPLSYIGRKISHIIFGKPNVPEEGAGETKPTIPYDKAKVDERVQELLKRKPSEILATTSTQNGVAIPYDKAKVDERVNELLNRKPVQTPNNDINHKTLDEIEKEAVSSSNTPLNPVEKPTVKEPISTKPTEPIKPKEPKVPKYIPSSAPVVIEDPELDQDIVKLVDKAGRYGNHAERLLEDI